MDSSWAQAFQGGGREACSPLYQTRTSYMAATWWRKCAAHGQCNRIHLFWLLRSPLSTFITKLPHAAPIPASGAIAMSTKFGLVMWPPDKNQLAQWDPRMKRIVSQHRFSYPSLWAPQLKWKLTNCLVIGALLFIVCTRWMFFFFLD